MQKQTKENFTYDTYVFHDILLLEEFLFHRLSEIKRQKSDH